MTSTTAQRPFVSFRPRARVTASITWAALTAAALSWAVAAFAIQTPAGWSMLLLFSAVWALASAVDRWTHVGALEAGPRLVALSLVVGTALLSVPVALGDPRAHALAWASSILFAAALHAAAPFVAIGDRRIARRDLIADVRAMLTVAGLVVLQVAILTTFAATGFGPADFAAGVAAAAFVFAPGVLSFRQARRARARHQKRTARPHERAVRSFPV